MVFRCPLCRAWNRLSRKSCHKCGCVTEFAFTKKRAEDYFGLWPWILAAAAVFGLIMAKFLKWE